MDARKLSVEHHRRLTAVALAEQANANQESPPRPSSPILPDLLTYLGRRQLGGELSAEQSKQFFENSARVKLRTRATVFKGDLAPIEVAIIATNPTPPWYVREQKTTLTVPGPDGRPATRPGSGGGSMSGVGASVASIFRVPAPPAGEPEVTVSQVIQIYHTQEIITEKTPPLHEFTINARTTLHVVDDAAQSIKLIDDPAREQAMSNSVSAKYLPPDPRRPASQLEFRIEFTAPPEGVAAEVIIRWTGEDGRAHERPASGVHIAKGKTTSWHASTERPRDLPQTVTNVDLILRPSQKVARETIDVTEMWNREIVIKDVPLDGAKR